MNSFILNDGVNNMSGMRPVISGQATEGEGILSQPAAVKAIIYDNQGRILLQHRDDIVGIWEPNRWGFFGGMVEEGETLETALKRELIEELGCEIGCIESELFKTDRASYGILNVAFLVRNSVTDQPDKRIHLNEGQSFGWFSLDELVSLPLSRLVIQHLSLLLHIFAKSDSGIEVKFEKALLEYCKLTRKNDRVFYAKETPVAIDMQSVLLLKELAVYRELPIFRVCLHQSDDEDIHEMMMVHTQPLLVGPLKQDKSSLSYHMLDGTADIWLHDDSGAKFWHARIDSCDDSGARSVRLKANIFRSMQTVSTYAIFLEVGSGPFQDNDTIWFGKGN